MAETNLNTSKTTLVAAKTIADTTFSEKGDINPVFPLTYRQDYQGKVIFSVIEDEETNIDEIKQAMSTKQESLTENGNATDERGERLRKNSEEYVEDLKRKVEASRQAQRTSTINRSAQNKSPPPGSKQCILFLPQAITFADGVQYENVDLGMVGGLAEQGGKGAVSTGGGFLASTGAGISSLIGSFTGGPAEGSAKLAANSVAGLGGDAAAAGVRSANRVTVNPNTRALFKSVNMRAFTFSFKLIPLSAAESLEIKKVVNFFRRELYPEQILLGEEQDQSGSVPLGYKFPNKINIEMFYNERGVATKILPCYLESVQTVYNNTSMGMHSDGSFQEVDITLNFREARTLHRKDIINGGY